MITQKVRLKGAHTCTRFWRIYLEYKLKPIRVCEMKWLLELIKMKTIVARSRAGWGTGFRWRKLIVEAVQDGGFVGWGVAYVFLGDCERIINVFLRKSGTKTGNFWKNQNNKLNTYVLQSSAKFTNLSNVIRPTDSLLKAANLATAASTAPAEIILNVEFIVQGGFL